MSPGNTEYAAGLKLLAHQDKGDTHRVLFCAL
jgi:hypothetical protein